MWSHVERLSWAGSCNTFVLIVVFIWGTAIGLEPGLEVLGRVLAWAASLYHLPSSPRGIYLAEPILGLLGLAVAEPACSSLRSSQNTGSFSLRGGFPGYGTYFSGQCSLAAVSA